MVSELDQYLFHQGTHFESYCFLGAHFDRDTGKTTFTVWAPNARGVAVALNENNWTGKNNELTRMKDSGLFTGTFQVAEHTVYKYMITPQTGQAFLKADPYAFYAEKRPLTASIVKDIHYDWQDEKWMKRKRRESHTKQPMNIYEVHLGTWKKHDTTQRPDDTIDSYTDRTYYSYIEMAETLVPYVKTMGYTHIELMPITEHPFDLSWGYQVTGYYAPTSRYGEPQDFKYLIDTCHRHNIGVILDWVPAHFCKDDHGLRLFDGTPLFEHPDPYRAEKRNWGTLTFDFGRTEVQSFLISNALFWLNEYHIDGLRVDAVHSMTDLNFENFEPHEQIFNDEGTSTHKEAVAFIKKMNQSIHEFAPHAMMIAEDSSDIMNITTPVELGGFGFDYKWDLGFMHDTLDYLEISPEARQAHHKHLNFPMMYRYNEQFILPFSHDEVVHGKLSMLDKMPGDQWRKFAQARLLYGYQLTQPGKKLNFMGSEIGMYAEWKDKEQVDWFLLNYPIHDGFHQFIKAMNHLYIREKALFELDYEYDGFQWIDADNNEQRILSYIRRAKDGTELVIVLNFSPEVYYDFKVGVSAAGKYRELFNSDNKLFGGSNQIISSYLFSEPHPMHGLPHSIKGKIPPLGFVIYKKVKERKRD
ncbi:1,4-alpha-glucan branching protein GlgB [Macrococcoides caseolyticum]|uniref:1,4-alpha-glucan branching protein GlgB n=1 Tax=Macrococcoides caseolyticum TaxID=69966 RepID=UPI001F391D73|nr:1,4-alpha-glucan branching protein GlgB [Macrococcus caseolyticus]MCE4956845.1 1,4-alpha-glucan branching protein GlgB [Macrococcus caseolyticus]